MRRWYSPVMLQESNPEDAVYDELVSSRSRKVREIGPVAAEEDGNNTSGLKGIKRGNTAYAGLQEFPEGFRVAVLFDFRCF